MFPSIFFYLGKLLPDLPNLLFVLQLPGLVLLLVWFEFPLSDKLKLCLLTGSEGPLKVNLQVFLLLGPECCYWWQTLIAPPALLSLFEV